MFMSGEENEVNSHIYDLLNSNVDVVSNCHCEEEAEPKGKDVNL